jgi:hypothetical protein
MPGNSYFPRRQADLVTWANTFASVLSASPTTYGSTAPIATAFSAKATALQTAYTTATTPTTRTKATIASKNDAIDAMKVAARPIVKTIYAQTTLTDAQLIAIGLRPHDVTPTPVPAPAAAPLMTVPSIFGRNVTLKIVDASGDHRGKPQGCAGAALYSFVGDEPPAGTSGWQPEGNITRAVVIVNFPAGTEPGTKVWFTANWYNTRGIAGPACTPVGAVIGMEGAAPLAA